MLVLSRRLEEKILLPTVPASVKVIAAHNGLVRLGIEAPAHVPILREELARQPLEFKDPASLAEAGNLRRVLRHRLNNIVLGLGVLRLRLEGDEEAGKTLRGLEQELELLRGCLARCPEMDETAEPVL